MARTAAARRPSPGTVQSNIIELDTEAIARREREVEQHSDEELLEGLNQRFDILTEMTKAVKRGEVRAMIVSGPPGVGKSHNVEAVLQKDGLFDTLGERKPKYEVVKGAMSAIGLYKKLYEYRDRKCILVFDDCDSVLLDDLALKIGRAHV